MKYFYIFNLNRHFLLTCASFFMLSAFSCSVSGMEAEERFLIRFLPNVTQKFKDYCINAVERKVPHTELRESLLEFAKEGESSAAHTLWHTYKNKSLPDLEQELREFASAKNPYACNLLATCLAEQRNSECLAWYQIFDANRTESDPDFRANYASAILGLKQPLDIEALEKVWSLLKGWRELDKTESDDVLEGLYLKLTSAAIEIKETEFICDLYIWANTHKDKIVNRGITLPITRNTEFANIVIERTKLVPLVIDTRNSIGNEMQCILKQAKRYLNHNQNNRQTVADIVCGNLAAMLQDSAVRNIPLMPENSKYFINFKQGDPTEKHLESWAILIVNKHRARLIEASDRNPAIQDMAKRVKNDELKKYVLAGFKEIYGYEKRQAS